MALSLQNLRDSILTATSTDLSDWTNGNTDLDLLINKSWWDIMDQFDFREKEAEPITFNTVAGTREYDVSTITTPIIFDALQNLSIQTIDGLNHENLELISVNTYENEYINSTDEQDQPLKYFRRGAKIWLFPTPDQVYTITFYFLQVISDISSGGPVIPQAWHEIIEYGANFRALLAKQEYQKANELKKHQALLINGRTPVKVKELADSRLAAVEMPGRDY